MSSQTGEGGGKEESDVGVESPGRMTDRSGVSRVQVGFFRRKNATAALEHRVRLHLFPGAYKEEIQ